ncbi:MAG: DNA2/NAM7 family helicase [Pyrinomonadaceae bacterium MAG19_C2-C3]|nr:DNA2/NAM7 family helicase [Pyrinomonadaceae bacterium MAG19_C2-C3]
MPSLSKKSLSLFLRTDCERQFILSLYSDTERRDPSLNLPPRQKLRAALGQVGQAGYDWQDKKVGELKDVFGQANVHENPVRTGKRPGKLDLLTALQNVEAFQFIVEAEYDSNNTSFRAAIGLTRLTDYYGKEVGISGTNPDIIQVLPSLFSTTNSQIVDEHNPYDIGVKPNGETFTLAQNDNRLRLRVIDIKLTSEPGAHYFAEVVYYSITLAAWIVEHKLNDQFVVVAAPAVWPGSHEASNIARQYEEWNRRAHNPSAEELALALEADIEIAPFDVFAPQLCRFLRERLPVMLSKPWQDLEWYVDYRCKGCEFLGYPWLDRNKVVQNDPLHCWPTAEKTGNLSRVVGLSRGASKQLQSGNVPDVTSLAATKAGATIFDGHQGLRSKRTSFPHRAAALQNNSTSVIPDSGGDAVMPKWPDLHVYIFLDYDLSSAITASIALRAFWKERLPFNSTLVANKTEWNRRSNEDEVFLIDRRSIERERDEFLKFLRQLRKIFNEVMQQDDKDSQDGRRDQKTLNSTYQIYLWDESQRKHLIRLIGRHLPYVLADSQLRGLAWLFPPPELMQPSEDASRQSPITLVSNVISNTIAIPIPHHYRLLDVVQTYLPTSYSSSPPHFHPHYQEPMSDLIPAERIHEYWQRVGRWTETQELIQETARKKIYALNLIVSRLEKDLKPFLSLKSAPILVRGPRNVAGVAPQSSLWLEYARLNAALNSLKVEATRAMPPHEREARLKSAYLNYRLSGQNEKAVLAAISQAEGVTITPAPDIFVYKMSKDSLDVNFKLGEFLCALSPKSVHGFLSEHPFRHIQGTSLKDDFRRSRTVADFEMTSVTIEAVDRVNGFIVLRASDSCRIWDLERETSLDFSKDVILDPIHKDFLTRKVEQTVRAIGHPPSALCDPRTAEALGLPNNMPAGSAPSSPAAEILWESPKVSTSQVQRHLVAIRSRLESLNIGNNSNLDSSQWDAWESALSCRFSLIWGPPGTGKSRTLRAVILGAVLDAITNRRPLRVLITANTYTAIDNVLLSVEKELKGILHTEPFEVYRIQSKWHIPPSDLAAKHPDLKNLILNSANPSTEIKELQKSLKKPNGIVVVGCTPQQLHNLAVAAKTHSVRNRPANTMRQWFDLIILDEASQMDVATSTLVFTKATSDGICVLAGDDLQLPPIHPAEPPKDLESVVGSVYNYFRHYHDIVPNSLDINYRSNKTIVMFTKTAGYSSKLQSNSPDLRLRLLSPVPTPKPLDWANELYWSSDWAKIVDPDYPTTCFVYDDRSSSQVNDFEADAVASLLWLMYGRIADKLENQRKPDGTIDTLLSSAPYSVNDFWGKAVGIVTPHRAQMAKIIHRLQHIFPAHPATDIRNAVDTVERFQGQQRDVIIGSFGLGDPDIISVEDEFLFNLNRFNVLTSRARAKVIIFVTRTLLDHLSNDVDVLKESRLLKMFAESYCTEAQAIQIGFIKNQIVQSKKGTLRRQ